MGIQRQAANRASRTLQLPPPADCAPPFRPRYTAWTAPSPSTSRRTQEHYHFIPCAFVTTRPTSSTRRPLLRSMYAHKQLAVRLLKAMGNTTTPGYRHHLGAEQNTSSSTRNHRAALDLRLCGRTLFGASRPRGRISANHYFARFRTCRDFMTDPTRSSGPGSRQDPGTTSRAAQYEIAPLFGTVNVATTTTSLRWRLS
jgi:glutamine synthetase